MPAGSWLASSKRSLLYKSRNSAKSCHRAETIIQLAGRWDAEAAQPTCYQRDVELLRALEYSQGQPRFGDGRREAWMAPDSAMQVSELLLDWGNGDREALKKILPLLYDELRRLARHYLRQQRSNHTLQTTALVHEAYLRLGQEDSLQVKNHAHFLEGDQPTFDHLVEPRQDLLDTLGGLDNFNDDRQILR